ncbi:zf-HC2 domain-containing protein (plasmid) [Burkholderia glumae]|nr:zf-HC2 domain-containing protein [Burkholderia glumae]
MIHRLIVERLDRTLSTDEASHVERHLSMCRTVVYLMSRCRNPKGM